MERREIKVSLEHLENKEYRDLLDQYQEELYIQDGEELHVQILPPGTELVYSGLAGGSSYTKTGGGANYLCLPETPQYLVSGLPSSYSYLYGAEYHRPRFTTHDHNVPCAVCYTSQRTSKLMIPARITCPSSWTEEYEGYLMAEYYDHPKNAVYECVDKNA